MNVCLPAQQSLHCPSESAVAVQHFLCLCRTETWPPGFDRVPWNVGRLVETFPVLITSVCCAYIHLASDSVRSRSPLSSETLARVSGVGRVERFGRPGAGVDRCWKGQEQWKDPRGPFISYQGPLTPWAVAHALSGCLVCEWKVLTYETLLLVQFLEAQMPSEPVRPVGAKGRASGDKPL